MNPVRRAADFLFCRQLRLRWRGGPRLAWEARDLAAASAAEEAEAARRQEHREILEQLAEVLDEMPDIRDSVRHLAFLEQALREHGLQALYGVPQDLLQQALDQFEGLVSNWSPRGLASLRSKMAVAVLERDGEGEASVLPQAIGAMSPVSPGATVRFNVGRG
ncbi:MAG: hypothetical protein OEU93_09680 [Rubrivivax sp.]|nr:hypothetical protein [Rubrivivax sp.]MDH5338302.1 hypothetical protein [Rubrivivax sp.]